MPTRLRIQARSDRVVAPQMEVAYRPSHADATYDFKYGIRAVAGGGRSSARETIGRVAAGAVAKKLLAELCPGIEVRPMEPAEHAACCTELLSASGMALACEAGDCGQ